MAAMDAGLNSITAFRWFPTPKDDNSPSFDCSVFRPFDREYCLIDRFEACAVGLTCGDINKPCEAESQSKLVHFAKCLEYDKQCNYAKDAPPCAAQAGLDSDAISACSNSTQAAKFMNQIYKVANTSSPVVTGFPDIRINGVVQPNYFPASDAELERAICNAYTGTKPSVCASLEMLV